MNWLWSLPMNAVLGGATTGVIHGLALAAFTALLLRALRRGNAATRYAVAYGALLTVAVLPFLHGAAAWPVATPRSPLVSQPVDQLESLLDTASAAPAELPASLPYVEDPRLTTPAVDDLPADTSSDRAVFGSGVTAGWHLEDTEAAGVEPDLVVDPSPASASLAAFPVAPGRLWTFQIPAWVGATLLSLWTLGAAVGLVRLLFQALALRRLRRESVEIEGSLAEVFGRLRESLGVHRPVTLRVSSDLSSPILIGWLRPVVLLPVTVADGDPSEAEPMLLHELAHVRRWDDWTNLLQQFVRCLLFFHPGVRWLCRRLDIDREIACDDHVLAAQGSPKRYALLLTQHAARNHGPRWSAAPAAWGNPNQLKERIHMLLNTHRNASPRLARMRAGAWTSAVLLLAVIGGYAAPRLALAASDSGGAEATATTTANSELTPAAVAGTTVSSAGVNPLLELTRPAATVSLAGAGATASAGAGASPAKVKERFVVGPVVESTPPVPPVPPEPVQHLAIEVAEPSVHEHPVVIMGPPNPPRPPMVVTTKPRNVQVRVASLEERAELEERIARLEKLVHQLLESRDPAAEKELQSLRSQLKRSDEAERRAQELSKLAQDMKGRVEAQVRFQEHEVQRLVDEARRSAELALRDQRGKMLIDENSNRSAGDRQRLQAQRRALEDHRRALEKQRADLERRMERLERETEQLDDAVERLDDEQQRAMDLRREGDENPAPKEKAPKERTEPATPGSPTPAPAPEPSPAGPSAGAGQRF